MNLKNLIENSHLDALGLLDAHEQSEFQQAFLAAPPAVQLQIRAEQARAADMSDLLPLVEPSPELRDRVLAAIASQISAEALAGEEAGIYDLRSPDRVSRRWRTAAIGLIGACCVLGVAFINVMAINAQIHPGMADNELAKEVMLGLGSERANDVLYSPSTHRDFFAAAPGCKGVASILRGRDWADAVLTFKDLPEVAGSDYRLVVLNDDGVPASSVTNLGRAAVKTQFAKVDPQFAKSGMRLAIVCTKVGADISTGTILLEAKLV